MEVAETDTAARFPDARARNIATLCARGAPAEALVRTSGRVVHIRRKSRLLLFFDLRAPDDASVGVAGRVTTVCKAGPLSAAEMQAVRADVRLGDIVVVVGPSEPAPPPGVPCVLALSVRVRTRWLGANPSRPFAPQPLGAHAFGAEATTADTVGTSASAVERASRPQHSRFFNDTATTEIYT